MNRLFDIDLRCAKIYGKHYKKTLVHLNDRSSNLWLSCHMNTYAHTQDEEEPSQTLSFPFSTRNNINITQTNEMHMKRKSSNNSVRHK